MDEKISYCGLICGGCPIFLVSRETDKAQKEVMINRIIDICKSTYGIIYKYEEINGCDGCKGGIDRLISGCKNCKIRTCAKRKGIKTAHTAKNMHAMNCKKYSGSIPTQK